MLSAESASGQYPIEAVSIMNKIILATEQDPIYHQMLTNSRVDPLKRLLIVLQFQHEKLRILFLYPSLLLFLKVA